MRRLLLLVVLLLLSACSAGTSPDSDRANERALVAVAAELRATEGVLQADATYSTSVTSYGAVSVSLTVADGTPAAAQEALLDRAEALVWRSAADPLLRIGLILLEQSTPSTAPGRQRAYVDESEIARLADRLGPRPER